LKAKVCIIGSGPAAHTSAIYTGRADLETLVFEGFMANGVAAGGQLTMTTFIENFPGFPEPISGLDLTDNFRKQSVRYGAKILTETVTHVQLDVHPFKVYSDTKEVDADVVIVATGASAKRLKFTGSETYWNNGISACAICDGGNPMLRNKPVAVVGGGDAAMEEAVYLTKYASKVYIVHRFDYLEASKVMQKRALSNPKIEVIWHHEVAEAYGNDKGALTGVKIKDNTTGAIKDLQVSGMFFAIGHKPATNFLGGQLQLDQLGYIVTVPGSTVTSVPGVFAAGDVQDHKFRQAICAAASGCMAAIEAEHYLQALSSGEHHEHHHEQVHKVVNNVLPGVMAAKQLTRKSSAA